MKYFEPGDIILKNSYKIIILSRVSGHTYNRILFLSNSLTLVEYAFYNIKDFICVFNSKYIYTDSNRGIYSK